MLVKKKEKKIKRDIESLDGVNSTQYVSEEDAINIMKDYFENNENYY